MKQPKPSEVRKARKAQLVAWSEERGLGTEGTVAELRDRILESLVETAEEEPPEAEAEAMERPESQPSEVVAEAGEAQAGGAEAAEPVEEKDLEKEEVAEEAGPEKEPVKGKEKARHVARSKPKLEAAVRQALILRRKLAAQRPAFRPQEWFRYDRLGEKWRKPQGMHSKLHRHFGYRPNVVSIGYRGPKAARGLHPSGFREVLVHNANDLERIDPNLEAARIAATVGTRKRLEIQAAADEKGIRVLNRREEE